MLTNPTVTLIVPIHGEAKFLEETLQSITRVEFKSLEVLLILDRPEENIRRLVYEFCKKNLNCRTINSSQPGISSALNCGIEAARGEFISRLDADDLISPLRIERQLHEFLKNFELVLVGTQMRIVDSAGNYLRTTAYPIRDRSIRKLLEIRNCIGHPTVMYRRSDVLNIGGYRSCFNGSEDLDLWLRLGVIGKFKTIDEELTTYRVSEFQETQKIKKNPGALEEIVILSNWDSRRHRHGEKYRLTKWPHLGINSNGRRYEVSVWSFLKLLSIRAIWRADLMRTRNRLISIFYLLISLMSSPPTCIRFLTYLIRIKLKNNQPVWN